MSSLIKYVNESEPGATPFHYRYALTGKVDEYLEQIGFKASDYSPQITGKLLQSHGLWWPG